MSNQNKNTMAGDIVNRAKNIVTEDTRKAEAMVKDAVKSRAYLYPIKGRVHLDFASSWLTYVQVSTTLLCTASCGNP
jgi:hypothetical protein